MWTGVVGALSCSAAVCSCQCILRVRVTSKSPLPWKSTGSMAAATPPEPMLTFLQPCNGGKEQWLSAAGRGSFRDLRDPFPMIFEGRCVLVQTEFD